jgi:phospholipid/cholesterol/gamma-HCH transport system substrate-binding protein
VAARLDSSGREINALTQRLNGLVGGLQDGEGTLGLLLRDTAMAAEIRHGLQYLDSGLVKFDQNMEALQHNFLTRGYFRKLERERERERRAEEKNR